MNLIKFNDNNSILPNLFEGELTYLYIINSIACFFVSIFAIRNFYFGNHLLAITLSSYVVCSAFTTYQLQKHRAQQSHINLCVMILLFALYLTVFIWGVSAVNWFYPVVIALVFILPPKISVVCNVLVLIGISWITFEALPFIESFRLTFSLFLSMLISYLIGAHVTKLHRVLQHESISDPLTGALNRRQLDKHLTQCKDSYNNHKIPASLLMIDIDHFKSINDTYGHDVGDDVLVGLAQLIKAYCRTNDLLFRIGGEEFILLLPNKSLNDAVNVANKLTAQLKAEPLIKQRVITVSIGVAQTRDEADSNSSWLKSADELMYQAKLTGRGRVCYDS
mgnify:CR=1 FL=1